MLRKCDGYFLADLFLSLSALFIIGALLMPLLTKVYDLKQNIEREHEATTILYEQLMEYKAVAEDPRSKVIMEDGIKYSIAVDRTQEKWEVCVIYEKERGENGQVCELFE
jgi:competence protein ComGE